MNPPTPASRRGLSVSSRISLGFSIVLALHISIAILGHYGLEKGKRDLATYDLIRQQAERFDEIDRVVGALQRNVLLFSSTGYQGSQSRALDLQDDLGRLLLQTETMAQGNEREAVAELRERLDAHREILDAVIIDRAKRRDLVNHSLVQYGNDFDRGSAVLSHTLEDPRASAELEASFRAAQLNSLQFVIAPDSAFVREAKFNLARTKSQLRSLARDASDPVRDVLEQLLVAVNDYEDALIQMVQATRGYLHLVNVVLAGESEEFRRLAGDIRAQQSENIQNLAQEMTDDSRRFQLASNVFSLITIVLGVLAAWIIGRSIARPLNAIAKTFKGLTAGQPCESIPGMGRSDELGSLAEAAHVFKEKAAQTERLLQVAESSSSELNELNRELAEQTELAESMAREAHAATLAKSEFLANMSHEIRTPMTAILGFAETLTENEDPPVQQEAIETIQRNGNHLLAIINDILDLSKVEAGKMSVELVEVCPFQLIRDVVSLVKVKADGAGLELSAHFPNPLPAKILTDPTRLRQILINLLGNAIKFTEVGKVELIADCRRSENSIQFDIIDTGIGMSSEQVQCLFEPFSQADASMSRKFGGTGLGLAVSKRLAQMLGGDLTVVESRLGTGTRFRLVVSTGPLDDVPWVIERETTSQVEVERTVPAQTPSLKGMRILLVEDGPDNQRLLSFVLKRAGAQIELNENGLQAVETALEEKQAGRPFDCVLMDMQMPVMGGAEATRRLRQAGYRHPILALTAHAMQGDEQKCISAGCNAVLTKPIVREQLIQEISRWVRADHWGATEPATSTSS